MAHEATGSSEHCPPHLLMLSGLKAHAPFLPVGTGWSPVAPHAALTSVASHMRYHSGSRAAWVRCLTAVLPSCDLFN